MQQKISIINFLKNIRWLTVSADQVVILILLLALAVKYVFFEERDELAEQLLLPETPTGEEASEFFLDPYLYDKFV